MATKDKEDTMCTLVPESSSFHLEWNNHLGNMQSVLESLYSRQLLVDVTLTCCDGVLKAHKVILSACSAYFENVFRETPCKHPVFILKGVSVREMQALLRFMYCGHVDVPEDDLATLVATACEFKVKGFALDVMKKIDNQARDQDSEAEAPSDRVPSTTSQNWKENMDVPEDVQDEELNINDESFVEGPLIVGTLSLEDTAIPNGKEDVKPSAEELAASLKAAKSGKAEATASTTGVTSSCSNSSASNSSGASSSASASSGSGEAAPYPRETRFKGQKRVDVGIRPPIGRLSRITEKRESSSSAADSRMNQTMGFSAKKPRTVGPVSSTSGERKKQDQSRDSKSQADVKSNVADLHAEASTHCIGGAGLQVVIKAEAESEDDDDDDEEATADMFCIPHLQESPDPEPGTSNGGQWTNSPGVSASGRERRVIADTPAEDGEGEMVCPYCYTSCPRNCDLKRHMRLHTEDKPHECEFCNLAFARASHLARHRRTHTGERPFRCPAPSCGRTFSRQDKLKLHTQRAHPGLPYEVAAGGPFVRLRGRRRIRDKGLPVGLCLGLASASSVQASSTSATAIAASSTTSATVPVPSTSTPVSGPALISLPFGDTSYLTSLSLGQQRYSDLTISPVSAGSTSSSGTGAASSSAGAEELLKSVRQLGECTIQTLPGKVVAE